MLLPQKSRDTGETAFVSHKEAVVTKTGSIWASGLVIYNRILLTRYFDQSLSPHKLNVIQ